MSAVGSTPVAGSHAQAQLGQQVSIAVAQKVQDAAKAQGQAVISLLEGAAAVAQQGPTEPGKGGLIDIHG